MDEHEDRTGVSALLMRMREEGSLPRLIAFDLDYTLWRCYCEFHEPPFSLRHPARPRGDDEDDATTSSTSSTAAPSQAYDRHGSRVDLFSEARAILHTLCKVPKKENAGNKIGFFCYVLIINYFLTIHISI